MIIKRHYRLEVADSARTLMLPDVIRPRGIHVQAGSGGGKSNLMGKLLAFQDMHRGNPTVVIDPVGQTINYFLNKVGRRHPKEQEQLWPRITYVNTAATGTHVVPWPLYYRLSPTDTHYDVSQRFLELIRRVDPSLETASIQGYNAVAEIGTHLGIILSAFGFQITEALEILNNFPKWKARIAQLGQENKSVDVQGAVKFFLTRYDGWKGATLESKTSSFVRKVEQLVLNPNLYPVVGASLPGIDWEKVVAERQCVLIDLSGELDPDMQQFKTLWIFRTFLDFVKHRGVAGRRRPISLFIDELAAMYQMHGSDLFARDMDELINVVARNMGVWLTLAHQESYQFSELTVKTLMSMSTQIIGGTSDPESARMLARYFYKYNPNLVKRWVKVWGSEEIPIAWRITTHQPIIIDSNPVEFTIDEQYLLAAMEYMESRPFHFMVKMPDEEGQTGGTLYRVNIENIDKGVHPDMTVINQVKEVLSLRGKPKEEILKEIQGRLTQNRPSQTDKISDENPNLSLPATTTDDTKPEAGRETKPDTSNPDTEGDDDWLNTNR